MEFMDISLPQMDIKIFGFKFTFDVDNHIHYKNSQEIQKIYCMQLIHSLIFYNNWVIHVSLSLFKVNYRCTNICTNLGIVLLIPVASLAKFIQRREQFIG